MSYNLFHFLSLFTCVLFILNSTNSANSANSQPILNSVEQDSVYRVLDSLNSDIPWRTLFPDDLCSSAPHGVVCGYTTLPTESDPGTVNILELNFGYVSDHNPNPPCNPNSSIPDPDIFTFFPYLRKLFFYNCFTQRPVSLNSFSKLGSGLEELVFVENPSLFGSLTLVNAGLKRLVITGTNVSGEIVNGFGGYESIEEITLSRNRFSGMIPENLGMMKKLKILDLSQNGLKGNIPLSIGNLESLVKLDLGYNLFSGNVPLSMKNLKNLEFLDLSYNKFSKCGIPLFLQEMSKLQGVYLSGNELGGVIPDIWEKLKDLNGIGFSGLGLVGNIPSSIGVFLGNLSYLALDNNSLSGKVPLEFEKLEKLNELNLKNNNLSGMLPFSPKFVTRIGGKLKVQGNRGLCVDKRVFRSFHKSNGSLSKLKVCKKIENPKSALVKVSSSSSLISCLVSYLVMFLWILFM